MSSKRSEFRIAPAVATAKGQWELSDGVAYRGKEIPLPCAQWPKCAADVEKAPKAPSQQVD